MVGGGRRDESLAISSSNVFAALGSLKKKKGSDKEQGSSKSKGSQKVPEKVFWAPAPLTVKSWADVDDEDDDDYYATTAPPESVWDAPKEHKAKDSEPVVEETDSEEGLDEADDDVEKEHENEPKMPVETEAVVYEAPVAPKDTERQLSKKELKKKGLEELDAVLAELGYTQNKSSEHDESHGVSQEKKEDNLHEEVEKKVTASGESKTSKKKKKKKDKASKEVKEIAHQAEDENAENETDESTGTENAEGSSPVDAKERLKKMTSVKKKKSSKEMDAAARAAATEAAARNAKLAAAKKKEKNHYNQQPVR